MKIVKKCSFIFAVLTGLLITGLAFAETTKGITGVADQLTTTIGSVGKMMVALSYLAGFGFLTFGVLKFKQHKDNPSQVPLGTPIVMTLIGAVLVFIGGFIAPLGETFGIKGGPGEAPTPGDSGSKS